MKTRHIPVVFLIYAVLAFPAFYFVYKFADPIDIAHDFFQYYRLYNNWDWQQVNAPFNMRVVSSFFVFLFNKAGFYYETASAFDKYTGYGFDKAVYFNALLFNFACVAATSTLIYAAVKKHFSNALLAFSSGLIYLLGFGTIFYELMPCTDSFSVLLFAGALLAYLQKSNSLLFLLVVAIFQREYILLAFGLLALVDLYYSRSRYYLAVALVCAAGFLAYFFLRRTLFYTPALSFQTSPGALADSLLTVTFPIGPFIRQTLISSTIFILYLWLVMYKCWKKLRINKQALLALCLLFLQIVAISFAAVLGNNAGRYFYIAVPLVIFELAREGRSLFYGENSLTDT